MKKRVFVCTVICALVVLLAACPGPFFGSLIMYIEVVDESGADIKDVHFSAALDGEPLSDLEIVTVEDENPELGMGSFTEFKNGIYVYELNSDTYSSRATAAGDPCIILPKITVTVSKAGYVSETICAYQEGQGSIPRVSITLKKESIEE